MNDRYDHQQQEHDELYRRTVEALIHCARHKATQEDIDLLAYFAGIPRTIHIKEQK